MIPTHFMSCWQQGQIRIALLGVIAESNGIVQLNRCSKPGFLGIESAREEVGITVSYWSDIDSIKRWKANSEHLEAQKTGRKSWYDSFKVRISKVERDYGI